MLFYCDSFLCVSGEFTRQLRVGVCCRCRRQFIVSGIGRAAVIVSFSYARILTLGLVSCASNTTHTRTIGPCESARAANVTDTNAMVFYRVLCIILTTFRCRRCRHQHCWLCMYYSDESLHIYAVYSRFHLHNIKHCAVYTEHFDAGRRFLNNRRFLEKSIPRRKDSMKKKTIESI